MRKTGKFAALAGLAVVWACAMDASAQGNKAVEDRQALMKSNGAAVAGITAFVKENKGTMADVQRHLATLQTNSGNVAKEALWPKGTSTAELGKATRAKSDIWTKWDDFKKADATFDAEVEKFAAVARGGDKAAIEPALATLGRNTCGACHTAFRGPQT
jgi:cytochrome c556